MTYDRHTTDILSEFLMARSWGSIGPFSSSVLNKSIYRSADIYPHVPIYYTTVVICSQGSKNPLYLMVKSVVWSVMFPSYQPGCVWNFGTPFHPLFHHHFLGNSWCQTRKVSEKLRPGASRFVVPVPPVRRKVLIFRMNPGISWGAGISPPHR